MSTKAGKRQKRKYRAGQRCPWCFKGKLTKNSCGISKHKGCLKCTVCSFTNY